MDTLQDLITVLSAAVAGFSIAWWLAGKNEKGTAVPLTTIHTPKEADGSFIPHHREPDT
jgi:hypothetical protein